MPVPQLHYYDISHGVVAFSTTRHGGYSKGNYGEFNINGYCGDNKDDVEKNRRLLAVELGVDESRIILPHQTHGVETRQIAGDFLSLPANVRQMILEGVDAVMTNMKGVCIGVSTADCIPIILYDANHHAACAVHAGWRGTVARILLKAVADMRLAYGTEAAQLKAVVGPGISLDAFEVGNEVYEEFANANFDMTPISKQIKVKGSDFEFKWHIDLPECNRQQLVMAGVKEENIQMCRICTYSNTQDYFSARQLGKDSGRIFTGIML